jgi:predicted phosphohydrolase
MLKLNYRNRRPTCYTYPFIKRIDGAAIVGINTVSLKDDSSIFGDITEKQYYELKRLLEIAAYQGTHIIVAMHHPPWDIIDYDKKIMKAFKEFNVNTVVYGHEHNNDHSREFGIDYYCVGGAYDEGKLLVIDLDRGRTVRRFMRWRKSN